MPIFPTMKLGGYKAREVKSYCDFYGCLSPVAVLSAHLARLFVFSVFAIESEKAGAYPFDSTPSPRENIAVVSVLTCWCTGAFLFVAFRTVQMRIDKLALLAYNILLMTLVLRRSRPCRETDYQSKR